MSKMYVNAGNLYVESRNAGVTGAPNLLSEPAIVSFSPLKCRVYTALPSIAKRKFVLSNSKLINQTSMEATSNTKFKTVDEYLHALPSHTRALLQEVRDTIKRAAPGAEEVISYNMPAFKLHGI